MLDLLRDYGLDDFYLELSTKPEDKAVGTDEEWDEATEALRAGGVEPTDLELVMDEGGGAFYGPKISVQARDAIGRTWQLSTIQLDFQLPQRFDLEYVGADNERHRPIMIHRALFGSIERFFGVLARALRRRVPGVAGAGAGARAAACATTTRPTPTRLVDRLQAEGFRVDMVDAPTSRSASASARPSSRRCPYVLVVGDDDVDARHGRRQRPRRRRARARRAGRRLRRAARAPRSTPTPRSR